jgi:hypothetical protein
VKKTINFILLVGLPVFAFTQETGIINRDNLFKNVAVLASDSLEGRNTGSEGQKKAAAYIQSKFKEYNLKQLSNNYYQHFFLAPNFSNGSLILNKQKLVFLEDFYSGSAVSTVFLKTNNIQSYTLKELNQIETQNIKAIILVIENLRDLNIDLLKKKGIKTVFVISNDYNKKYFEDRKNKIRVANSDNIEIFFIDGNSLRKKLKKRNKLTLSLEIDNGNCQKTENVLAYVEGTDSILKKEFIVVSAHYDHLGIKDNLIFNGADDNASGTSALLEIARVMSEQKAQKKGNKRSVLFICFTGEEHGLLGSSFYTENPLIPLNKTVANLNIDMIGRGELQEDQSKKNIYIIGSDKISLEFHKLHEQVAKEQDKLFLNYMYNEESHPDKLYYRSDHYNFAKNGIPSIFYFGGFHPDYHQVTDDIEKLDFVKIQMVAELVFLMAVELAN